MSCPHQWDGECNKCWLARVNRENGSLTSYLLGLVVNRYRTLGRRTEIGDGNTIDRP
jgi:hypothetical protein